MLLLDFRKRGKARSVVAAACKCRLPYLVWLKVVIVTSQMHPYKPWHVIGWKFLSLVAIYGWQWHVWQLMLRQSENSLPSARIVIWFSLQKSTGNVQKLGMFNWCELGPKDPIYRCVVSFRTKREPMCLDTEPALTVPVFWREPRTDGASKWLIQL